jgi:Flp pilus assembly pilin Flp
MLRRSRDICLNAGVHSLQREHVSHPRSREFCGNSQFEPGHGGCCRSSVPHRKSVVRSRPSGLLQDTRGLAALEYILLLCLIAIVGYAAWRQFGRTVEAHTASATTYISGAYTAGGVGGTTAAIASAGTGSGASSGDGAGSSGDGGAPSDSGTGDEDGSWLGRVGRGDPSDVEDSIRRGITDGLADVVDGVIDGAIAVGGAIVDAIADPSRIADAVAGAIANPGETAASVVEGAISAAGTVIDGATDWVRRLRDGDAYTRARMLTGAGATAIPVGAAANVVRGAGAASRVARAVDRVAIESDRRPPRVLGPDDGTPPRNFGRTVEEDVHIARQRREYRDAVAEAERRARADGWTPSGPGRVIDMDRTDTHDRGRGQRYGDPDYQNPEGVDSVLIHGSPDSFMREEAVGVTRRVEHTVTPEELARDRDAAGDAPVVLISCQAGRPCPHGEPSAAQRYADASNRHVVAATNTVEDGTIPTVVRSGGDRTVDPEGGWRVFSPRSRQEIESQQAASRASREREMAEIDRQLFGDGDGNPFNPSPRAPTADSPRVMDRGGASDPRVAERHPGPYAPDRELPRDRHGNPVPDVDAPHTQLGTSRGRRGSYTTAREFDANGQETRTIDFTDHGRPSEHPYPHQHRRLPNETGGTPQRGGAEPVEGYRGPTRSEPTGRSDSRMDTRRTAPSQQTTQSAPDPG